MTWVRVRTEVVQDRDKIRGYGVKAGRVTERVEVGAAKIRLAFAYQMRVAVGV